MRLYLRVGFGEADVTVPLNAVMFLVMDAKKPNLICK